MVYKRGKGSNMSKNCPHGLWMTPKAYQNCEIVFWGCRKGFAINSLKMTLTHSQKKYAVKEILTTESRNVR